MASILETFYILFKTNTTEVKKGTNEAKDATKKLNESLLSSDDIVKKIGGSFSDLATSFGASLVALTSAGGFISALKDAADYSNQLSVVTQELDLSANALDVWSRAVERSGGSAQGFQSALRSIESTLASASIGQTGAAFFPLAQLGINLRNGSGYKSSLEILLEIGEALHRLNLNRLEVKGLGQQLGFDAGTILFLQKNAAELRNLSNSQKDLYQVTEQDTKAAFEFNNALTDTKESFRGAFLQLDTLLLPRMESFLKILNSVAQFIQKHKVGIADFFTVLTAGIVEFTAALAVYKSVMLVAAVATATFESPLLLIAAAIVGLAVLFGVLDESYTNFLKGNNSVVGEIIKGWDGVAERINNVIKLFKDFISFISGASLPGVSVAFSGAEYGKKLAEFIGTANSSPLSSQTSSSITTSSLFNNKDVKVSIGEINIETQAVDSDGIAGEVGNSLKNHIRQAMNTFSSGVLA